MCENLKQDRVRCDVCRTINLAKTGKHEKPNMQMYDKCTPMKPADCGGPYELPLNPTCIKVCTKEEYQMRRQPPPIRRLPYYAHGKLMYCVKAGVLVGAVYFTYTQGVWGDQQDVTECLRRWQEYVRSFHTRRPPVFDQCGRVIKKDKVESVVAPVYNIYKSIVTTCFAGVVKVPVFIKCAYVDYLKALQKKYEEDVKERNIRRRG